MATLGPWRDRLNRSRAASRQKISSIANPGGNGCQFPADIAHTCFGLFYHKIAIFPSPLTTKHASVLYNRAIQGNVYRLYKTSGAAVLANRRFGDKRGRANFACGRSSTVRCGLAYTTIALGTSRLEMVGMRVMSGIPDIILSSPPIACAWNCPQSEWGRQGWYCSQLITSVLKMSRCCT
jgi:hypothetical protein